MGRGCEATISADDKLTDVEKLNKLKQAFAKLQLPVDFVKVPEWKSPGQDKYFASVRGKAVLYTDLKGSFDELLAQTAGALFKAIYRDLRTKAGDRKSLAYAAYYHIVGQLGSFIRVDIPEETRRRPRWMKLGDPAFPSYGALGGFNVDHVYYSQDDGYVSEPYNMSMEDFENLAKYCREHGLMFTVEGESRWFPGHTFRVTIKLRG